DRPEGKAFAPVIGSSKAPGTGGTPANTGAPHGGADADAKSKMRRAVGPHPSGHPGARPAEAKTESTPPVQATPSPAPSPAPSSGASPAPAPAPAPAPPPAGKNP
ncbi:MAG TPA: DNA polymerase III subunit gamma and tau, partial [Planctomycetota bacterium]|nr:DNA polymerase III subunit gamma and tau [Planctomycetota bacterium]